MPKKFPCNLEKMTTERFPRRLATSGTQEQPSIDWSQECRQAIYTQVMMQNNSMCHWHAIFLGELIEKVVNLGERLAEFLPAMLLVFGNTHNPSVQLLNGNEILLKRSCLSTLRAIQSRCEVCRP